MPGKTASQRADTQAPVPSRVSVPAMRASARKRADAGASRKAKRAKRARIPGGRLAAATRIARLRAGRAAEERHRERR
jgi:hypothetical protein